jgi:RNA recognition motif-containing protein
LFVANLPFSVDDAGLAEIFAGLNLKSAHVVRKRNNRSKGFGFVEFNNADDQNKALQAVDKKTVQERELIVKAALTVAPGAAGAAAPAAGSPAPASPAPAAAATP